MKRIEQGKVISRTVAGVGCSACHGQFGEGDVGIGPYLRGVGLFKIEAAVATVVQMKIVKDRLKPEETRAVAAYYSWLGQLQLVKTLVKRDRFIPETADVFPGTTLQVAINNTGQAPRRFTGPDMNVAEFQVSGKEVREFVWRAPEREGAYALRCVDCIVPGQQLTINVRKSAKRHIYPDKDVSTVTAK